MTSVVLVAPLPIHADSEIAQSTPLSILFSRQRDAYAKDGTYSTYGVFFDQSRSFAISNVRSSPYPPFIDGKLDQSIWDWRRLIMASRASVEFSSPLSKASQVRR